LVGLLSACRHVFETPCTSLYRMPSGTTTTTTSHQTLHSTEICVHTIVEHASAVKAVHFLTNTIRDGQTSLTMSQSSIGSEQSTCMQCVVWNTDTGQRMYRFKINERNNFAVFHDWFSLISSGFHPPPFVIHSNSSTRLAFPLLCEIILSLSPVTEHRYQ
jgi:hypothetical protein